MAKFNSKSFEPGVLVTSPRGVLIAGIIVSVLLHAGLGVWAWEQGIGITQPEVSATGPMRIKRALLTDDDWSSALGGSAEQEIEAGPSAQDLSQRMLDAAPPPIGEAMAIELSLRDIEEPFEGMTGGLEIDLPAFELNDDVLAALDSHSPSELNFENPGIGEGNGGEGDGQGRGSIGMAGDALEGVGSAPRRTEGGIPEVRVNRPVLDEPSALRDIVPDITPMLDDSPIDFVELALGDTTQIEVPENLDDDFAYRVTRFTPTDRRGRPTEAGYFRVDITAQRSLRKLETMPKDVVFIIDTSSSVPQDWVAEVTRGVRESLVTLNEGDRFNIVLFNDRVSLLSEEGTIDANAENIEQARVFLDSAQSVGYTDVNAAMRSLLVRDVDQDRVYELVLISDGQSTRGVTSTRDLINLITRDNDLVAGIYCVGVSSRQNRELLNFLAYRNRGFSVYADRKEDAARVIGDLMSRLRYPIIKGVSLNVAGLDDNESGGTVFPMDLPDIHQGETISVFGRFDEASEFTMRLTGISAGNNVEFTFTRDLDRAPVGEEQISTDWAFWKLHHLYSRIIEEGEQPQLLDEVERLRQRYGLRTLY